MSKSPYLSVAGVALAAAIGLAVSPARADDAEMAKSAKISIVQAIEAAEAKGGGKATEADFEDDNGGRWEIKVIADGGNKLTEYYIDPNSGEVKGQEEQTFEKYFTMLKPEDFSKAQVQLKDAIAAAEKAAGGKAYGAEVERSGDAVAYEIDVITDQGDKDVDVDATGNAKVD
ncbi:PepSY domain-containing protein [Hansschlegelia zhihuaiae]|uniref:PepSY domain-containing protein n=1 Tax=Hansschlegelia zhihuaiae TaxID=405005 RepID=A0A4Q0MA08_9HYPH|nr:PepSY domain-containing protein [Hansschlegelia zhihuaiae]RXF69606.1 hypothetical protein EK403_18600 [Hansschlegelia zhihuaiae]